MRRLYLVAIICACVVVSLLVIGVITLNQPRTDESPEGNDLTPTQTESEPTPTETEPDTTPTETDEPETTETESDTTPTETDEPETTETEPDTTPTETDEPEPTTPSPVQLESGMVVLYYKQTSGSSTSYETVEGQILKLESSAGNILRYIPEQGELLIISGYISTSWSTGDKRPYTIDGRLFMVDIGIDAGIASFSEWGIGEVAYIDTNADEYNWYEDDYAIVGDRLYYRTRHRWDPFATSGYSGGDLYVCDLNRDAPNKKYLLGYDHPDNSIHGELISTGDRLYRVEKDIENPILTINRLDLETGMIANSHTIFLLSESRSGSSYWYEFAADQDALYIGAQEHDSLLVSIWRISWADIEEGNFDFSNIGSTSPIFSQSLLYERDIITCLDADEGYVVIDIFGWDYGYFIVYDHNTGSANTYHLGDAGDNEVQIMQVR